MKFFSSHMLKNFGSHLTWELSWTPFHKWSPLFQWTWARLTFRYKRVYHHSALQARNMVHGSNLNWNRCILRNIRFALDPDVGFDLFSCRNPFVQFIYYILRPFTIFWGNPFPIRLFSLISPTVFNIGNHFLALKIISYLSYGPWSSLKDQGITTACLIIYMYMLGLQYVTWRKVQKIRSLSLSTSIL